MRDGTIDERLAGPTADAAPGERRVDELDPVAMFRAKAQIKARLFHDEALEVEPTVGRYTLRQMIGRGGFGAVFRAEDPTLDREVAIKLVPLGSSTAATSAAELDEARVMARLRHPSLVAVYDVGTCDASALLGAQARRCLFIVMELLGGQSLRRWLATGRRSAREIIGVHAQAARGIAAAHEQGIVHRDLKPSNIHIEHDRVIVLDFGLATVIGDSTPGEGAIAGPGTPSYMAPEQHDGGSVGPAADQFALAVCLFESLYGRLPHPGGDLEAKRGGPPVLPSRPRVPSRIRRVLTRALDPVPARRFGSMDQVAAVLAHRRRRWIAGLAAVTGALLTGAWLGGVGRPPPPDPCGQFSEQARQLWGPQARATVREVFASHQLPYGDSAFSTVSRALEERLSAWAEAKARVCRAGSTKLGAGPGAAKDYCLDRYYERAAAVVSVLLRANPEVVANVNRLVDELERGRECERDGALPPRPGWLIDDAPAGLAIDELIVRAQAQAAAGDGERARTLATTALERARALEAPGLEAEASWVLCHSYGGFDGRAKTRQICELALVASERAGRPDLAVEILLHLTTTYSDAHPDEIRVPLRLAEARREGLGPDPVLDARIAEVHARLAAAEGNYEQAVTAMLQVRSVFEAELGPDAYATLEVTNALGLALQSMGEYERAADELRRFEEGVRATLGPGHPRMGAAYNNLGLNCFLAADVVCAREALEEALAVKESTKGPRSPALLTTLENLTFVYSELDDREAALASVRRAIAIARDLPDEQHQFDQLRALEISIDDDPPDRRTCQALEDILMRHQSNSTVSYVAVAGDRAGGCWTTVGDLEAAHRVYETIVDAGGLEELTAFDRVRMLEKIARLAHALGHDDEARRWLEQVVGDARAPLRRRRNALAVLAVLPGADPIVREQWLDRALALEVDGKPETRASLVEQARAWLVP